MTMITPSYLGETIEYSSLHACRSTLEDPTFSRDDIVAQVNSGLLLLSPSRSISYRLIRGWFEEEPGRSFDSVRYVDPTLCAR